MPQPQYQRIHNPINPTVCGILFSKLTLNALKQYQEVSGISDDKEYIAYTDNKNIITLSRAKKMSVDKGNIHARCYFENGEIGFFNCNPEDKEFGTFEKILIEAENLEKRNH